jgi:hypothetical protein
MAGSPKKRAAREAAEREKNLTAGAAEVAAQSTTSVAQLDRATVLPATDDAGSNPADGATVPVLQGEILPPADTTEPTRTALKRAMRTRAQGHADAAIAVLVEALGGPDKKEARAAANDLLAWGFGKPATEIEAGDGAQMIVIRRFGDAL